MSWGSPNTVGRGPASSHEVLVVSHWRAIARRRSERSPTSQRPSRQATLHGARRGAADVVPSLPPAGGRRRAGGRRGPWPARQTPWPALPRKRRRRWRAWRLCGRPWSLPWRRRVPPKGPAPWRAKAAPRRRKRKCRSAEPRRLSVWPSWSRKALSAATPRDAPWGPSYRPSTRAAIARGWGRHGVSARIRLGRSARIGHTAALGWVPQWAQGSAHMPSW